MLDDGLPAAEVLRRLFHAEGLALGRPRALAYGCRCSRARLAEVLAGFGDRDLDHMAQEDGAITMTCEFCNLDFRFARAEVQGGSGGAARCDSCHSERLGCCGRFLRARACFSFHP